MENEKLNIKDQFHTKGENDVFHLPDGYFDELTSNILKETVESRESSQNFNWSLMVGIAACGLFMLISMLNQGNRSGSVNTEIVSADTSSWNYTSYLVANDVEIEDEWISDIETEELAIELLNDEASAQAELDSDDIVEYLNQEDIDVSDWYEEIEDLDGLLCFDC